MGRRRPYRAARVAAGVVALVVVLGACEFNIAQRVNEARTAAGRATLPVSTVLSDAARAHSREMCAAGAAAPSPDAGKEYDQETHGGVYELVGSAPLRPEVKAEHRNVTASNEVWAGWRTNAQLTAVRWDDVGIGEVECADGRLYLTAVLRDAPSMLSSGMYSTPQYAAAQVEEIGGLQYGEAVNQQGVNQALLLDLYLPPAITPAARPLIVLVHGGGFVGGNRASAATDARSWARRGFAAASISYRLGLPPGPGGQLVAAGRAIDDAMESVRWLKANATTYRIDPDRIAMVGFSAGGAIALGVALTDDVTPGGPLAAFTPTIDAGISTGAHLTPGIAAGLVTFDESDAEVMMFHYESDSTTSNTAAYAFETCAAARAAGSTCDFIAQPGAGHTTWLEPGGTWWAPEVGPFIWRWLLHG